MRKTSIVMLKKLTLILSLALVFFSCKDNKEKFLFSYVPVSNSNILFANTIVENDSINPVNFQYCYNGGGVGVGDFNNDGLPDLVFTGNQVSSKIYLNNGALNFTDISEKSHFFTSSWVTGVAIVDINADGWDDVYLSVGGSNCTNGCENLLFINQGLDKNGIPQFKEEAKAYGLEDPERYTQQALFFDYDQDGDLDVYIVHNSGTTKEKNNPTPKKYRPNYLTDYLLRNDQVEGMDHPIFTNVSEQLNIVEKGFGLGVGINDFNGDNLPDIYVSNDFITDDLLYINNASKNNLQPKFIESSKAYISHQSFNAMGMDIADINNDTFPDVLVLDMLPKEYKRQKTMLGAMNYDKFLMSQENDYSPQYVRNTLQLGNGFIDGVPIKASEVGFMVGISSTDWSWAPLMADFDNDGDKDIFITNGFVKDVTDLDFINYSSQSTMFGTAESKSKKLIASIENLPGIHLPNFFYEQDSIQRFKDVSSKWVEEKPSFSNGAVFVDLDLDGDLDIVVNNINETAFVMENHASEQKGNHYLRLQLIGKKLNSKAIGSKITLWDKGKVQTQYQSVIRGYLSSVDPIIHFGLEDDQIDSLKVIWPDGKITMKYAVKANQLLALKQNDSKKVAPIKSKENLLFKLTAGIIDFVHEKKFSNDYVYQHLLMKQYSQMGPCIVAGNIDGKIGDEIFIGGGKDESGRLWFQNSSGNYLPKQSLDSIYEDSNAAFVDVDNDGDLDLYVSSGGNSFQSGSKNYQDRLYLNDGKGYFTKDEKALPSSFQSTSTITTTDIDNDGDMDFFIGARLTPQSYPNIPESSILINTNGKFKQQKDAEIAKIGMVTDAIWQDLDNDGWQDLIVVGEWMEISVFKNKKGKLEPWTISWLDKKNNKIDTKGWWNCIAAADFDKDGDIDFMLGNQGINGFMEPSQKEPIYMYKKDFDLNGSPDPIIAQYFEIKNGLELLPVHTRDDIMQQLSLLQKKYHSYEDFANTNFQQLLNIKNLESETLKASTFESSYAENLGYGTFKLTPLPKACQLSPINDILIDDYDKDGQMDALMVGNDFSAENHYGIYDALNGILLRGNSTFFDVIPNRKSGFYVPKQSHHIIKIKDRTNRVLLIAAQNNGSLKVFSITEN
jgi:hypothetical protein